MDVTGPGDIERAMPVPGIGKEELQNRLKQAAMSWISKERMDRIYRKRRRNPKQTLLLSTDTKAEALLSSTGKKSNRVMESTASKSAAVPPASSPTPQKDVVDYFMEVRDILMDDVPAGVDVKSADQVSATAEVWTDTPADVGEVDVEYVVDVTEVLTDADGDDVPIRFTIFDDDDEGALDDRRGIPDGVAAVVLDADFGDVDGRRAASADVGEGASAVVEVLTDWEEGGEDDATADGRRMREVKARPAGEAEEGSVEEDVVSVVLLRTLDLVFFVLEKVVTVGIPDLIKLCTTASSRWNKIQEKGDGSEGWKLLSNAKSGEKRY